MYASYKAPRCDIMQYEPKKDSRALVVALAQV